MKWTEQQQKVIDTEHKNLLVSAAAGSGKTAVLVARILRMLTDPEDPVSVDRLLIMTFTRAAAEEMRERIGTALREAIRKDPENRWLRLQKALLPRARIATIDSICQNLIKQNYELLSLDPGFRVADEGELKLMRNDILTEILEEKYQEGDETFLRFAEIYGTGRSDDRLRELVEKAYRFIDSHPWPLRCLKQQREEILRESRGELGSLPWMQYLFGDLRGRMEEYRSLLQRAELCCQEPDGPLPYLEGVRELQQWGETLAAAEDYGKLQELLAGLKFQSLKQVRGPKYDPEKKAQVKAVCDQMKAYVKGLRESYGTLPEEALLLELRETAPYLLELCSLVEAFALRYEAGRREKNLVDFSDMEHLALRLLYREQEGEMVPSELADELAGQFHEILIDEYQDSNLVQEALVQALSGERFGRPNVFMVGDVKQSIYRFRLAKPELFMDKYGSYTSEISEEKNDLKIELNRNFRSRPEVLYSVNDIFFKIMQQHVGGVEYTDKTALYPGAAFPEGGKPGSYRTELLLLNLAEKEEEDDSGKLELEARLIAGRIREMIPLGGKEAPFMISDGKGGFRPLRYRDVVILLRAPGTTAEQLVDTLGDYGIPAYTENASGYFSAPEVETMLAFLSVIDNPHQDIPLAAVLRSEAGGFGDDDLAFIRGEFDRRMEEKTPECRDLYAALSDMAKSQGEKTLLGKKAASFLKLLEGLRRHGDFMPVYQLLSEIYRETGYYACVSALPFGMQRRKNLDMLLERARIFSETSYSGIFHFVRYIEELRKYDTDYGEAGTASEQDDLVRITSIHKSKGLEYPVVFLAGLDRQFNRQDTKETVLIDPDLGVASDYVDLESRVRYPGLKKEVLKQKLLTDSYGEELRVLYVAMTRAREKLILTAAVNDAVKKLEKWQGISGLLGEEEKLPKGVLMNGSSYLDLILMGLSEKGTNVEKKIISPYELSDREEVRETDRLREYEGLRSLDLREMGDLSLAEELSDRESWSYPWQEDTRLSPKKTVSELRADAEGDYDDLSEAESEFLLQCEDPEITEALQILSGRLSQEGQGARRGTAYHRVFQLLSFGTETDARQEILRMQAQGKLTEEEAALVDPEVIGHFLESDLGKRMAEAAARGALYRERRFMIGVPARELSPGAESQSLQLLQGIIDAYMENEDGSLSLIDYKTDGFYGLSREEAEECLRKRYGIQLGLYSRALEQLLGKPVKEQLIYSTFLGRTLPL